VRRPRRLSARRAPGGPCLMVGVTAARPAAALRCPEPPLGGRDCLLVPAGGRAVHPDWESWRKGVYTRARAAGKQARMGPGRAVGGRRRQMDASTYLPWQGRARMARAPIAPHSSKRAPIQTGGGAGVGGAGGLACGDDGNDRDFPLYGAWGFYGMAVGQIDPGGRAVLHREGPAAPKRRAGPSMAPRGRRAAAGGPGAAASAPAARGGQRARVRAACNAMERAPRVLAAYAAWLVVVGLMTKGRGRRHSRGAAAAMDRAWKMQVSVGRLGAARRSVGSSEAGRGVQLVAAPTSHEAGSLRPVPRQSCAGGGTPAAQALLWEERWVEDGGGGEAV
jgi:hypothetical protein